MPVPRHRDISIGTAVSIVLKADQRTGRQVQGTVAQLLTRGDHPRGVKVRLSDGRIGRVQQLASKISYNPPSTTYNRYTSMNHPEENPWQSATSQGNPYAPQGYQPQGQYGQTQLQNQQTQYSNNQSNQEYMQHNPPPGPPPQRVQRSDTDTLLEQQPDRAEQLEHMQNYEASAQETADDKNQAQLQKEFPNVDSSLIAALYSDTKDLAATREMLQELAST